MNPELLRHYLHHHHDGLLSRRRALGLGVAATAAATVAASTTASATSTSRKPPRPVVDDTIFDYADPANLPDWTPSIYGAGDERGSFNEVTPDVTGRALAMLGGRRRVRTYNLGELMANGFPAFVTTPPRIYEQRLTLGGYEPPPGFEADGGIVHPFGPLGSNKVSVHEERFACLQVGDYPPLSTTYQIGTQLDNLNHVGAEAFFYNGFVGTEIARSWGTTALGGENMGPIVTRGVLLDVLGVKLARGDADALGPPAANGRPVLASNYRVTIDDLEDAMDFGRIRSLRAGDAVVIRTGWSQLLARTNRAYDPEDLARWNAAGGMPGIYVAEAKYFGHVRPALVGSDTWALEALGSPDNDPDAAFPVHQELLMRHGVRIAESVNLEGLADAGIYEFVYVVTPQFAEGSTCGNAPPVALVADRRRRD
jgi:kynurenine formamidase